MRHAKAAQFILVAALAAIAVGIGGLPAPRLANTISIGEAAGRPGETVSLPVTLQAAGDCSALLLRLEYDPGALEAPSAGEGAILAPAHSFDAFSPQPGRLNLVACGLTEIAPFASQTGVVAELHFRIRNEAPEGAVEIALTSAGTPDLPNSNLLDAAGATLTHGVAAGRVIVKPRLAGAKTWMLY